MSINPAWRPVGESPEVLFSERAWLQGDVLVGVAYGVEATLFFMTIRLLYLQGVSAGKWSKAAPFMVYMTVMFIIGTLYVAGCSEMTQLSFVDQRNFPGGPSAYETIEFGIPIDEMANAILVMANWFADALIIWRYYVIFKGCRVPTWIVMILPCLLYLASIALGIVFLVQVSVSSPWGSEAGISFTIPYFSMSLSINVITCISIVARLLYFRRRIVRSLGRAHGTHLTSIAAMIVESSALYCAFSLCFLITFAVNNPIQNLFIQVLGEIEIIAPFLIIFRVASGKAWSQDTATRILTQNAHPSQASRFSQPYHGNLNTKLEEYRMHHRGISSTKAFHLDVGPTDGSSAVKLDRMITVTQEVFTDADTPESQTTTFKDSHAETTMV